MTRVLVAWLLAISLALVAAGASGGGAAERSEGASTGAQEAAARPVAGAAGWQVVGHSPTPFHPLGASSDAPGVSPVEVAGVEHTAPGGERVVDATSGAGGQALLGAWTQVPRTWPVPTAGGALAYDAARGEVLTFGGCCYQGDTWLWNDGWRQADPLLEPSPRASNVMAYDPLREEVVMFGGSQEGETWTWDGHAWQVHYPVPSPQFRNDAVMAFLPKIGKVVLFGGYPNLTGGQRNDTWTWDGTSWEQVSTSVAPPGRYAPGLGLDPVGGDLVLFGGLSDTYESLADTWAFDGSSWREVETETAPSPRSYVQMAGNPTVGAVELFGGYAREDGFATLDDRWWFVDGQWTQQLPGVDEGPLPPGRLGGGFVHDTADGTMVLLGGSCDSPCGGVWTQRLEDVEREDGTVGRRLVWDEIAPDWPPNRARAGTMVADPLGRGTLMHGGYGDSFGRGNPTDTWVWDGEWRKLETDGAPPGRQGLSLAVHPASETVLLFGGLLSPLEPADDTTWVLEGNRWETKQPADSPPGRYHAGMAEDPAGNVVLFGGFLFEGFGEGVQRVGDTWTWDGETWTQQESPSSPSPRAYAHMAYDPVRQETLLFGGDDGSGETWVWDGERWEQRLPPISPPGRTGAAMAWDPGSQQIVLLGGTTCASVVCLITDEVWTWDGATWLRYEHLGGGPRPRRFAVAGPTQDGIVLFGGLPGGNELALSDTWLWEAQGGLP